ncbi:exopolysaccharide transport protein family protein [Roseibium album]|nr:exopolysaccharide transport protein family protein [Roseibium album]
MGRYKEDWNSADWEDRRGKHVGSWESDEVRWYEDDSLPHQYDGYPAVEEPGHRKYDRRVYEPEHSGHTSEEFSDYSALRRYETKPSRQSHRQQSDGRTITVLRSQFQQSSDPHVSSAEESYGPFLDFRTLVSAVYENRRFVLLAIIGGMVLGGFATTLVSPKYSSQTSLYFDPSKLSIVWDGQSQNPASSQTASALVNSQIEILTSNVVLRDAVQKLTLYEDPEFRGSGSPESSHVAAAVLGEKVHTNRIGDSYIVSLSVTSSEPQKSAEVANAIVESFLDYENTTASDSFSNFSTNLDDRLEVLRNKAFTAEKAVEDYRAENDLVTAKGVLISDDRLAALNTALVQAQQKTIQASAKVDAAKRLSLETAVAGISETEVSSASLVQLRRQYATASSELGRLRSQLGSRHPSLAAAEASLNGLRGEINQELKRISSIAQTELSQAQKAQDETAKELAAQKALKLSNSPNQATLDNLELQASTARSIYESVLKSTRQSNEEFNNSITNVRVLGRAEPPLKADGPGRKTLLVGGVLGGAVFGFGVGLLFALAGRLLRNPSFRGYFSSTRR